MRKRNREVVTQSQALERMQRNQMLAQTYQLEKQRLEQIIELALMVETSSQRWEEYTRLKAMASRIVGFQAKHDELATSGHYTVLLEFIDWLLPVVNDHDVEWDEIG